MLRAAIKAGCDAVYFGIQGLNMRAAAHNFELKEVKKIVSFCHQHKAKAYCAVNVIIYEKELKLLDKILPTLKQAKVDAVICWDFAVISLCEKLKLPIHLSTQASLSNSQAINSLHSKFRQIERVILARECSLEDIQEIKQKTKLEIEIFVQGARCISYSGRCFLSQELFNKSANRGECLQPCRREYKVMDEENKEMILDNNFIMSAKDLCALPLLPKIVELGVDCLKIEGRNRGADYVYTVVSAYREALEAIKKNKFNEQLVNKLTERLKTVYNKEFTTGFLVDYPHHQRCDVYGSKAATEKVILGKISNFYNKKGVAEFKVESAGFKLGDKLAFIGPTTGYHEEIIYEIHNSRGKTGQVKKGETIAVQLSSKVRENDKVYLIKKRE